MSKHQALGAFLTILAVSMLSCAVFRSTRVGVLGGTSGHPEGDAEMRAVTLSVEPFAGMADSEPERRAAPPEGWVSPAEHAAVLEELAELRKVYEDAIALPWLELREQAEPEEFCALVPVTLEPEHHDQWWESAEFLAWLSGFAALVLGYLFRKPIGAVARKAVGRGGDA